MNEEVDLWDEMTDDELYEKIHNVGFQKGKLEERERINRVWAMPNSLTFNIKPIKSLLNEYIGNGLNWIDPFANNSDLVEFSNDINPNCNTKFHLEAFDFVEQLTGEYNGVLFDPPYSMHQTNQMYMGYGLRKQVSLIMDIIAEKIILGGYAISFGWNSNGFGKKRGFEIVRILIVAHGGSHNDTIVVVEKKIKQLQKEIHSQQNPTQSNGSMNNGLGTSSADTKEIKEEKQDEN